ncbi:esterase [Roseibium aquae]|uniref:Esterase n=1 Tax=Roseibium aquae TaxID=1323746 RepID=A0A916X2X0_9HYPH|nr:alpha/beta hydrolase [Roseibium aquae]GGB53882.1 esterase [Roseibium aquae]
MPDLSGIDWDDAFANGPYIANAMGYPDLWTDLAQNFRNTHPRKELDCAYGTHPREVFDLFWPDEEARGLVVFVHGGYWLKFDKSFWSHLAKGPLAHGWAVALPSYVLAPEARLPDMTWQVAAALAAAAEKVRGPIHLAGHSAGGHLVSRMACANAPLAADLRVRVKRVVSISGLHHLEPLQLTKMNDDLRLDLQQAVEESAALQDPAGGIDTVCWVGAQERPEFLRQTRLLEECWKRKGAHVRAVYEEDRHHFNVIDGLADPGSALTNALIG